MSITTSSRKMTAQEQMVYDIGVKQGRYDEKQRILKILSEWGVHADVLYDKFYANGYIDFKSQILEYLQQEEL